MPQLIGFDVSLIDIWFPPIVKFFIFLLLSEVFGLLGVWLMWKRLSRLPRPTPGPHTREPLPYFGGAVIAIAVLLILSWMGCGLIIGALAFLFTWLGAKKVIRLIQQSNRDTLRKERVRKLYPS